VGPCEAIALVALCLVRPQPNDVFYATRLLFDPGSDGHWLRLCAVVAVLRGGALEPESQTLWVKNCMLKLTLIASVYLQRNAEGLSLSGGASIRSRACSS
jgi:hypothetical protein